MFNINDYFFKQNWMNKRLKNIHCDIKYIRKVKILKSFGILRKFFASFDKFTIKILSFLLSFLKL